MGVFINLIGSKCGKLVVIKKLGKDKCGNIIWECKCDCGNRINVISRNLNNNTTKSCGCLKNKIKHGYSRHGKISKTYKIWSAMIQRCNNPNDPAYKNYGGRNFPIVVCDRWSNKKTGFENFLKDVGEIPKGLTLDRINNNKGYNPNNWRFASRKDQARNRRNNKLYYYNGKKQCISAWAEEYKINKGILRYRIVVLKWSIEKTLLTPVKKYKKGEKRWLMKLENI